MLCQLSAKPRLTILMFTDDNFYICNATALFGKQCFPKENVHFGYVQAYILLSINRDFGRIFPTSCVHGMSLKARETWE